MIVSFDGRRESSTGDKPNNLVRWTGQFLVADADGNKLEHSWESNGVPRMNYQGARNSASQLLDRLTARLYEKHLRPIRKATYTLTSR
ncbi:MULTISPECIES: hypothetical protein [Pseudomonas]|uniref:hypothetical protein n=1 Tax=Pseudomonas TaxID=286 RepID=UPI003A8A8229